MLYDIRLKNVFTSLPKHCPNFFLFIYLFFPIFFKISLLAILQVIHVHLDAKPRHSYRVAQPTNLSSLTENRLSESGHIHTLTAQQNNTADVKIFSASLVQPARASACTYPIYFTQNFASRAHAKKERKIKRALGRNFRPQSHERTSL